MDVSATSRRTVLREALPTSVAMLGRRRACDIPTGYIDEYVALDWLEWRGGSLRLTTVGENILQVLSKELA